MLVSAFHFAALSRAELEKHDRVSFYLYADEFQSFLTPSFGLMLAEDRKYGLHLTLAHQFTSQLMAEVQEASFGNVATFVSFPTCSLSEDPSTGCILRWRISS
jgi:hypothetical protein